MKGIGGLLILLGAGSFVLGMIGYEFKLLAWIDNWGVTTGNIIRVAMVVVGAGLWVVGMKQESGGESPGGGEE